MWIQHGPLPFSTGLYCWLIEILYQPLLCVHCFYQWTFISPRFILHPPASTEQSDMPLSPEPRKLPGWPAAPSGSLTPLIEPFHYWRWVVCTAVWDKSFNRFLCALQFSCASRCERTITVERVDQSDVVKALFTMEIVRMGLSGSKSAGSLCLGSF